MTVPAAWLIRTILARAAAFITALFVLVLAAAAPGAAFAEAGSPAVFPAEFAKPMAAWNSALERLDLSLAEDSIADHTLEAARAKLDDLGGSISQFLEDLRPRVDAARGQAEKLGQAPGSGQPAEPDTVALQRTDVAKTLADLTAAQKAGEAALLKVRDLSGRARDIRRLLFERRVLQRVISPLSPRLWADVAENMPAALGRLALVLTDWWQRIASQAQFLIILAASLILWGGLAVAARRWVRHYRHWQESEPPSVWRRSASAGWVILLRALPTVAAAAFLYFALTSFDLMPPPAIKLLLVAVLALGIVAAVQAVARTVLAINRPQWRLLTLSDDAAARLYRRLLLLAILYGIDMAVGTLSHLASMPYSLSIAQSFIASAGIAALIISILRIRTGTGGDGGSAPRRIGPRYVRVPLWLIAFAILGAALTGYVALARFIAGQLIITSTTIILAYLFLIWAGAFGQSLADDNALAGQWLRDHAGLSRRRREQLALPLALLLKAVIILIAVPFILLMWGFDARDVAGWVEKALFGFDIGNTRISITTAVAALVIFVASYAGARTFQIWLDNHVLQPAGVEGSVRDSVRTGVGYLGVGAAVLLAVSYAGFDFSNLAIVAGALSVGLGFGMQSVVNNFVSGLILLAERPIKVGDWIVVGTDEGIVRRISVRATEIETFDRANVIIPNSQLISQSVKNWTLHNNTGRTAISVGVHYDSDPEEVRDILLQVAKAHPQVLSTPEPFVFFQDFGDSSLKFVLYVYLANVMHSFPVRTDLRIAILKVFRARGIEIPYQQTDVHLRDLDWIKRAIIERMAKGRGDDVPAAARDFDPENAAINPRDADAGSNGNGA